MFKVLIQGALELVMTIVEQAAQAGDDPQALIAGAVARTRTREQGVTATQQAVLDILDGTRPLDASRR